VRRTELRLPTESPATQRANKSVWNDGRAVDRADFFTVGYSGQSITELLDSLVRAGVATLVDIRHNPVSMYRPEVSRGNLQRALEVRGIRYFHVRDLGVPREVRGLAVGEDSRDAIWEWYDSNVVPNYAGRNLHWFFNALEHPVAFMCTEFDPRECHRHRLSVALEHQGLMGFEL
jgi:uncharacterized protein (DUF488 family)